MIKTGIASLSILSVLLLLSACKDQCFHNGHEFVDLGLSVKWATCNIGAEKPEDYKPGRSYGDILLYGIYAEEHGFDGGYGIVFNYNVEYKDPALLSGDDLKLIPVSKYLKGELDSDEFYRNVRILELKKEKEKEDEYLSVFCSSLAELGIK